MPTPKQEAKTAITAEKESGDKYSVESMRANMSTGGGEPIPKGEKRTTQKRVLQPRDPDTGEFEFNASALYGRKYPDRSKEGHDPISARGWMLPDGIKKGDKVNIGDKVWIAIDDIDADTMREYFKNYDEEKGEFFSGGQKLSDRFIRKQGRESKEEKAGIAAGDRVIGQVDLNKVSNKSKVEMKAKIDSVLANGFVPSEHYSLVLGKMEAPISQEKLSKNMQKNMQKKEMNNQQSAPVQQETKEEVKEEVKEEPQKEEPKQEAPQQEQKASFEVDYSAMEKDPNAYYESNKEYWDKRVSAYNNKKGKNYTPQQFMKALLNKKKAGK